MNVFLSWSGTHSQAAADVLRAWLGDVLTGTNVWMSAHDVKPGSPWGSELHQRLAKTDFGILCLTRENLTSAWLLYETGCLAMRVGSGRLVPYLLDVESGQVTGPLAQLQAVTASRHGTRAMLVAMNDAMLTPLPSDRLERLFEKWWPDLEKALGLTLRVLLVDGVAVLEVGPSAADAFDQMSRRVDALLEDGATGIVVDLSSISHLSTVSLGHMIPLSMLCRKRRVPIAFVRLQPGVRKTIHTLGMVDAFPPFDSVDAALEAFAEKRRRESEPPPELRHPG